MRGKREESRGEQSKPFLRRSAPIGDPFAKDTAGPKKKFSWAAFWDSGKGKILAAVLSCLGSVIGVLLAFYLTYVAAYNSLTPLHLTLFLFMWLVPTPLIAGWVDRY